MDWWMDLLTTYTHHSELRIITALSLTSTLYKSTQHPLSLFPACCIFISRSLATACNSGDYSISLAKVLSSQPPVQSSTLNRKLTTDNWLLPGWRPFHTNHIASLHKLTFIWLLTRCRFTATSLSSIHRLTFNSQLTRSESESVSYITTDGQSASLSWNKSPVWGIAGDLAEIRNKHLSNT
jgi:hypothetical protein